MITEIEARKSYNCPACNNAKEQNSLVCWDCFKRREDVTPLKYFEGTFTEWMKLIKN